MADPDAGRARLRGIEAARILVHPDGGQLAQVAAIAEEGLLLPVLDTPLSLAEARTAHELGEGGRTCGKIVLLTA